MTNRPGSLFNVQWLMRQIFCQTLNCPWDARKNSLSQNFAKPLIFKGLILRTRDFARSQEVENRERERAENGKIWAKLVDAKSARKSEKPRQAWGPTGLFKGKERLFTLG